ncbi:hypothetical protein CANINC_004464 [Pichia inconspicua]|uniref:Uncharacterized protein n=1 Tax=Pichia inconspicua TaxID=52247 RepID=A0A4T0WVC3_9ASCO|nr:hypothetical protein CANINC_004464 [[Candida] inconspicua]
MHRIGRYSGVLLKQSVIERSIAQRWNSSIVHKKTQEEEERETYSNLPWEAENNESVADTELPWDQDPLEPVQPTVEPIDPSKNELILGPVRKKTSIIEKLKKTKKTSHNDKLGNETLAFKVERDYKNLMQYRQNISPESFCNIIDELKPKDPVITIKQLTELAHTLDKSFRMKQLKAYIDEACSEITVKKSDNKKKLISRIISEHWKLKVTLDPTKDLVVETKIDLSEKRDLFFLLSNRGFLPQHWSLIGAQLSLGKSRKELVVRGSKNIVNFVQASWNDLLNNLSTDTIDMKSIKKFCEEQNKTLNLELLQQESGVYFDKLELTFMDENETGDSDTYVLSSIKNSMINKAKTELLNATQFRVGCSKIVLFELVKECKKILIEEEVSDDSLPWFIEQEKYFRYASEKRRQCESLLSDDSMIARALSDEVEKLRVEVEEAKEKFEFNYVETDEDREKFEEMKKKDAEFFKLNNDNILKPDVDEIVKQIDIARLEKELSDIKVNRDISKLMLNDVISVKFGKILVEKNNLENTYFNPNINEVIRNIGKLELMDKEAKFFGPTGGILNRFSKQAHVQLIPNGFWKNNLDNFLKFPSIDILIDMKDNRLEVNRFTSFVCEAERDVEIAIPELEYDLKFQNSVNSMFIYNKDQWILNGRTAEEFGDNHDDMVLNKQQLNMFISQIGKKRLDLKRPEGTKGLIKQLKAKPYSLQFGNEVVKYVALRVEIVRNLELDYKGRPVILELRDDGSHEKVEVQMLHERGAIAEFVKDAVSFAQEMK